MNTNYIEAYIKDLLILCHILDMFEEFSSDLVQLISNRSLNKIIKQIKRLSNNKIVLSTKIHKFYNKHCVVLDIIKRLSTIESFIKNNYARNGKCKLRPFYSYFIKHKNELQNVFNVLNKIQTLSFDTVQFDEKADFSTEIFTVDEIFGKNSIISYMDNIEIVSVEGDVATYRTLYSNYKMQLHTSYREYEQCDIVVNSLVFDPNRLPDYLTKVKTFNVIMDLYERKKEEIIGSTNQLHNQRFELMDEVSPDLQNTALSTTHKI